MSDYTKSTNFATKDALSSGNPLKIVKGTEIDTEFNNIQTAIATKADLASPTFTGTVVIPTATITTATISAGTITGITDLAVADGGTGASTAANARSNLGTVADTASNGIAVRTSANTLTARSVTASTGISVSNGDGVSGNPTISNSGVLSVKGQSSDTSLTGNVTLSDLASFANSISSNGYQKFPAGLIIQWGSFTSNVDTAQTVSFPLEFPSACYMVCTNISTNTSITFTTTTFSFDRSDSVSGSPTVYFIALGS